MQLTCPHCQFSKQVDETTLPPRINQVTCPRCQKSFPLQRQTATAEQSRTVDEQPQGSTPVAVVLTDPQIDPKQLPKAGFWVRLTAAMLDGMLVLMLQAMLGGMLFLVGTFNGSSGNSLVLLVQIFIYLLGFVYYIFFTGYCGQTPGKMAVRIKVIRCDGSPLTYPRAAFRELPAKFISKIIFGIGYLMVAFDEQKQGLHDRMADTFVIKL